MSASRKVLGWLVGTVPVLALAAAACSSDDDPIAPAPPAAEAGADAGDAVPDAAPDADAGTALVDAKPEPIVCAVSPCAVEIVAGADAVCVRIQDGTVQCWGANTSGELGRGPGAGTSSGTPARVAGLSGVTQLAGGASDPGDTFCARKGDGSVFCWGSNAHGNLGRVLDDDTVDLESSPTASPVAGVAGATGVFVGSAVSCATLSAKDVTCWGTNGASQLPDQPPGALDAFPAAPVALDAGVVQLAIADRGTIALTTDATLLSWGLRGALLGPSTGVLGREVSLDVARPGPIDLARVSAVSASIGRACAVANGSVFCWGAGPSAGSDSVYPTPTGVGVELAYAQSLSVGPRTVCATLSDGVARCWGDNSKGQLGNGNADLQPVPVTVQGLAGRAVRMATMEASTCAILVTGAVQCWGQNDHGQLGVGTVDGLASLTPRTVTLAP
ncbi:MAG: hypothetical protein KF764_11710 [Labilithrix sp.]|nr:hypothetical protein [Labilithrix sp.]